ncbi:VTT domain-containing protein [Nocardioides terrisoli]|uniref:VTT domain-containing protein n=1 Tax=Nocardioides terrisoli TaxID=3388267 RepID=UPI00287B8D62|nr:VTT domain-containing protein [Nocardioides marmorisolisilvae]
MKLLLLTLVFGTLSAVIPVFNMEAYIVLAYARSSGHSELALAAIGSLGQNIGKLVWYYAARGALDIPWLQQKLAEPKRQKSYEKWRQQVEGRPALSFVLTFVSATVGFPPFFAIAMIAGTLRMNVVVFFVAGLVGRTLFFWAILAGVGLAIH